MKELIGVAEFYKGRSVFITGATGFMGKVLVEKLLRSCPEIGSLYLLMRPSKGKDAATRLKDLTNNPVFDELKRDYPEAFTKLVPVEGDILFPGLGVSVADLDVMRDSVSVVFHSAARLKFDNDLRDALTSNVKGSREVITFFRQLKQLKVFLHVSTAYNNLDKAELSELVYPASIDPEKLVDVVDCMNDELLSNITKYLIGSCPNVYAYTKALTEQLLQKECTTHGIPLVIVRPSIVTAAVNEPFPGWIDNLNGPSGAVAGIGKGFLRAIYGNTNLVVDLVPVDFSVNFVIAAAWNRAMEDKVADGVVVPVYNYSSGSLNPLTWKEFREYGMAAWMKYPTREMMWYPGVTFYDSCLAFKMATAFYHYLPAYLLDLFTRLCGRRPFLVRLYDKAHRALSCLDFYTMRQWKFVNVNAIRLMEKMSAEDRRVFCFDVRDISWNDYIQTYVRGTRRFLLKDDPNTLPSAKRNLTRLYWLRTAFYVIVFGLTVLFFVWLLGCLMNVDGLFHQLDLFGSWTADRIIFGHIAMGDLPKI